MTVKVSRYLMAGSAPEADQFVCDIDEVLKGLRETLSQLPAEAQGGIRLGLTAQMPEAIRTHGTWSYDAGPLMIHIARMDT